MILLWGITYDTPLASVHKALLQRGAPCVFLDQNDDAFLDMEVDCAGRVDGLLRYGDREFRLVDFSGVYLRPNDPERLGRFDGAEPDDQNLLAALTVNAGLISWADIADALVVNRPAAMVSNNSKPYQSRLIRDSGFLVPETFITTDPDAARRFVREYDRVIYKSLSGVRSIVTKLGKEHDARLASVANCPTQFQEWVPGSDWRVHVVGETIFPCEVLSDATDYRYPRANEKFPKVISRDLPDPVAELCVNMAQKMGLQLAGIDLRRTPDGRWYCFEVNPSPGFTFYEKATGQPIAAAIAELLAEQHRADQVFPTAYLP